MSESTTEPAKNPAASTAGAMPYWWFLSAALLVVAMDQLGDQGTRPEGKMFKLVDLGVGAAVAVIWLRGWRILPAVAAAGLLSGILEHYGWSSVIYAASLVSAAVLARGLLHLCHFDSRLRTVPDVLALAVLAAPIAAMAAAFFAFLPLAWGHGADWRLLAKTLGAEWMACWSGIVLLAPFLFSLREEYFSRWSPARSWEWLLMNLLLVGSLLLMMTYLANAEAHWFTLAYLPLPFIFWVAWRYGPPGAALANIFLGGATSFCAWSGVGPFADLTSFGVETLASTFLGFLGMVSLLLAAVTDERRIELQQQRQRARFFRQVLDKMPSGFLLKDIHDRPLVVNRRWFQLFGRAGGTEDDQLRHQQGVEPFWRARELSLLQNLGETAREEATSVDAQGRTLELLLTKQAAYFDERDERLLMVVADDVASGRASLAQARAALADLRLTLGVADVGIWDWNIPAGMIQYDRKFAEITGLTESAGSLAVPVWQANIHPEDRGLFQHDLLRHLHHQEKLFATHFRYHRGSRWVWLVVRGRVVEQDERKLGVRMLGTLQEARANVGPLPDPEGPRPPLDKPVASR